MASQYSHNDQGNSSKQGINREIIKDRMIEIREYLVNDLGSARKNIENLSIDTRGTEFEQIAQAIDTNFMRFKINDINQTIDQFINQ